MADQPLWDSATADPNITLSNGDRTAALPTNQAGSARTVAGLTSGKFYVEASYTSSVGFNPRLGVVQSTQSMTNYDPGSNATSWVILFENGNKRNNNVSTAYGNSSAVTDVIMMAVDVGAGKVWWGENGTWFASGDPANGTGEAYSGLTGTIHCIMGRASNGGTKSVTFTTVAGYTYSPPTGFLAGWGSSTTTYDQALSAALTATATIQRQASKLVSATTTLTGAVFKTVSKPLSAALPMAASLAKLALRPVAMVASAVMTPSMQRTTTKVVSAALSGTASMARTVGKGITSTCTMTATMTRALGMILVAALTASASMTRTALITLVALLGLTGVLEKIKASIVVMTATLTGTASMTAGVLFTRVLEASITLTAELYRTIAKLLQAALATIASPIQWVAQQYAAIRNDKVNWNQCPRCARKVRPNKMIQQMEYRGPALVWTGLYVCHSCHDEPQPQGIWPRKTGGDPKPVPLARPRRDG